MIFTYRPEFVPKWGGKSYHSQVTLNRLSNRESLAMVANLLGNPHIDRDLKEMVLEKTEGNPCWTINKMLAHATTKRSSTHDYSQLIDRLAPLLFDVVTEVRAARGNARTP